MLYLLKISHIYVLNSRSFPGGGGHVFTKAQKKTVIYATQKRFKQHFTCFFLLFLHICSIKMTIITLL